MRFYMKSRQSHVPPIAAAKTDSARPPPIASKPIRDCHPRRRTRLHAASRPARRVSHSEIVPMMKSAHSIRAVAIFEKICRRHPDIAPDVRHTLERRIAGCLALHRPHRDMIFRQEHPPERMDLPTSPTWPAPTSPLRVSRSITGCTTSGWRSRSSSMPM